LKGLLNQAWETAILSVTRLSLGIGFGGGKSMSCAIVVFLRWVGKTNALSIIAGSCFTDERSTLISFFPEYSNR
jgi:hypothetical protein